MNTLRIDRLNLKCRGVLSGTAAGALRELGPVLQNHLNESSRPAPAPTAGKASGALQVRAGVTSSALAGAVAARVTEVIRSRSNPGCQKS